MQPYYGRTPDPGPLDGAWIEKVRAIKRARVVDWLHDCALELGVIGDHNYARMAELGVFRGQLSKNLLKVFAPEILALVDVWGTIGEAKGKIQSTHKQTDWDAIYLDLNRRWAASEPVLFLRSWTAPAAQVFPDGYFDLVYIDADHTYPGVMADLAAWLPKIKRPGIVAGHDLKRRNSEVIDAVQEVFGDYYIEGPRTAWMAYLR